MLEILMSDNIGFRPEWKSDIPNMPNALAYGTAGVASDGNIYFLARLTTGTNPYGIYRLNGTAVTPIVTGITGILTGARMFVVGMRCYVIGFGTGSTETRQLRWYDLNSRSWFAMGVNYSNPLLWSAVCTHNNSAYFCGSTARNDTRITRFQLDANGMGYTQINYPTPNVNRSHMLIAANDEYIFYGAGFDDTLDPVVFYKDFYKLRKSDGQITRLADLPEEGYFGCSYARSGDRIIAINPMSGTNASSTATFSNKTFIYSIADNNWMVGKPGPSNYNMAQCAIKDNVFYRIGGRNTGATWSDTIDTFGPV